MMCAISYRRKILKIVVDFLNKHVTDIISPVSQQTTYNTRMTLAANTSFRSKLIVIRYNVSKYFKKKNPFLSNSLKAAASLHNKVNTLAL